MAEINSIKIGNITYTLRDSNLSNYTTTAVLKDTYVTQATFTNKLSNYTTTADLKNTYATKLSLEDYVKQSDLGENGSINLSNYVTQDDLTDYITQDTLTNYITQDVLTGYNYIETSKLTDENGTFMGNYITKDVLDDYFLSSQFDTYFNDNLNSNKVLTEDNTSITPNLAITTENGTKIATIQIGNQEEITLYAPTSSSTSTISYGILSHNTVDIQSNDFDEYGNYHLSLSDPLIEIHCTSVSTPIICTAFYKTDNDATNNGWYIHAVIPVTITDNGKTYIYYQTPKQYYTDNIKLTFEYNYTTYSN